MSDTVAYQGVPGSFGEEACQRFLPGHSRIAKPTFAAVAEAVRNGETSLGMLPRNNSTVGSVPGIDALIERNRLVVRASHDLPVRLHLMVRPGTALADVKAVISHPVALGQCAGSIARLGLPAEAADNTAMAARSLAGDSGLDKAAIASEEAAATYGLTILIRDVHDRPDNATTFCVVARGDGNHT